MGLVFGRTFDTGLVDRNERFSGHKGKAVAGTVPSKSHLGVVVPDVGYISALHMKRPIDLPEEGRIAGICYAKLIQARGGILIGHRTGRATEF